MAIDYARLKNWSFPAIEQTYTDRDTMLYALGLGLGADPLDESQLRFVYEKALLALPTMAGVLGQLGLWLRDPASGVDATQTVHGEQRMTLHRPLPATGTVVAVNRVQAVVDKGAGRGALVLTERTLTDKETGTLLATLLHTAFCRGEGGFSAGGRDSDTAPAPRPPLPQAAPDIVLDFATRPESALIYRLSGDRTALHADPAVARAAGFERPILHGMATFGIAGYALLKACCGLDPARLLGIGGRFSSPVFPGETLRTEIWTDAAGGHVRFRSRVAERGVVVLDNGYADTAAGPG